MRTNIEIDDELMLEMLRVSGAATKRAAVEEALRQYVQLKKQGEVRHLFGKVKWTGDLEESRRDRDDRDRKPATGRRKAA